MDEMARQLQKDNKIVLLASGVDCYMSQDTFAHYQHDIAAFLKAFHEERPHQAGAMIDDILTGPLKSIERKTARLLIDFMAQKNIFVIDSNMMRLPDFVPQDDSAFFKKLDEFKIFCGNLEFQLPLIDELQHGLSMGEKEFSLFLKDLRERGEAFVIGGKFVLAKDVEEKFITIVKEIKDDITIAAVRDITGSSRKFVLPLLEYLDARGYTRRVGEKRVLLLHKLEQKSQK